MDGMKPGTLLLGRYRILETLGEGGTARVFLTEDIRLHRKVAVKQFCPEYRLFEREVALLQGLSLQELPIIYDAFTDDSGTAYIVMEYVSGVSLSDFMKEKGILPDKQLYLWGRQLGEFLMRLHGGTPPVLYRDLKPDNIMVTEQGTLRFVDLGAAVSVSGYGFREFSRVGTAGYASPEQWDGTGIDPRSDLYSLGVVLRELTEYGEGELVGRRISSFRPVIDTCTAYQKEERYASAEEFLKAWEKAFKKRGKRMRERFLLASATDASLLPAVLVLAERAGILNAFFDINLPLACRPMPTVFVSFILYGMLKLGTFSQKRTENVAVEKTVWCRS